MQRVIIFALLLFFPAVLHARVIKWEGKPLLVSISTERITRIEFPESVRSAFLSRSEIAVEKEERSLYVRALAPEVGLEETPDAKKQFSLMEWTRKNVINGTQDGGEFLCQTTQLGKTTADRTGNFKAVGKWIRCRAKKTHLTQWALFTSLIRVPVAPRATAWRRTLPSARPAALCSSIFGSCRRSREGHLQVCSRPR
jgi:hypothetical protein